MSALSELLRAANTEDLTIDQLTDRMKRDGHAIGRDTVWKYMAGRNTNVRRTYLAMFAEFFKLSLDDLEVAANIAPTRGPWSPPEEAAALDDRQREALNVMIRSMAQESALDVARRAEASEVSPAELDAAGRPDAADELRRFHGAYANQLRRQQSGAHPDMATFTDDELLDEVRSRMRLMAQQLGDVEAPVSQDEVAARRVRVRQSLEAEDLAASAGEVQQSPTVGDQSTAGEENQDPETQ